MNDAQADRTLPDEIGKIVADTLRKADMVFYVLAASDYRILYINRMSARLAGLAEPKADEDAVGRYAGEVVPDWETNLKLLNDEARESGKIVRVGSHKWECAHGVTYWDMAIIPYADELTGETTCLTTAGIDVSEREEVVEDLAESRRLLDAVLNSLSAHVAVIDGQGTIILVNEAWRRFARENGDPALAHTGIGVNYLDVCRRARGRHSEGADRALEGLEAILSGRLQEFELEYPCPSPTEERWFYLRAAPLADHQQGAVTAHIDITRLKQVEEALRESDERFSRIIETTPSGITIVDRDGRITSANPTAETILGLTRSEITGRMYNDPSWKITTVDGEPLPSDQLVFERIIETGRPVYGMEHAIERPDGTRVILSINAAPLTDASGAITGMVAVLTDITARTMWEQSLQESEEKYRTLVEMMGEGLARADRDYAFTFVNDAFARMLGYTPQEMVGRKLIDCLPEETREQMREQMARRRKGEVARYELAWQSKDGGTVYTQVSPRPVYDEDGNFAGSVAVLTNITGRKLMEEALQESEERYRLLFYSNPLPMLVYDIETLRILAVNDAMVSHYGYSEEEFLSMTIKDIRPPEDVSALLENVRRVTEGLDRAGVWRHRKKDGTIISVEITSHTLTWAGRHAEVVLANDVTERIRAEEQVRIEQQLRTEFYRRTILAATEGKLAIADRADIERIEGPVLASWHVDSAEVQSVVRHEAAQTAEREGMERSRAGNFEVCVGEATTNAIKHADGGEASLHHQSDALLFVITDHGPGIEALSLPDVALTRGFSTAGTLGMGYKLMIADADRVYLATGPDGTTVAIEMKLTKPETPMLGPFPGLGSG